MEKNQFLEEISNFTFTSKYARFDEKKGRRETWEEAVSRLEKMHLKRFSWLDEKDKSEISWAFDRVREKLVAPSMRSLQFGGKAIEAHEARVFNCLGKDTQFITSHGVKSFSDFEDGDSVTVLTHKGNWKSATVRYYGNDNLFPIKITRCRNEQIVYATSDHRWLLKDGGETTSIKEGDYLLGAPDIFSEFDYESALPDEKLYWAYGLVYGDGSIVNSGNNRYSMIRLCGNDKRFQNRFEELGFKTSAPNSCGGDFFAYTGTYLKTSPNPERDEPRLIRAFVRGYLDADGAKDKNIRRNNISKNQFLSIQSSEREHIDFIRKCFPIAGIYIVSEKELTGEKTNFGVRPYTISFRVTNSINNQINSNTPFSVSSIGESKFDEVWCLEVEDDNSFVLSSGLTTGNCSVRHIDSLRSFAEIFYLLLCGCGTGIGLSNKFLGRLPDLVDANDKTGIVLTYQVADNIEGWADSVEALLMCYFKNTAYTGRKIIFDYSRIRKKGEPLKTGGGKAPGYKGLKRAHQRVKEILDHIIEQDSETRLKTIHAYDILMHCADAVLSGGIRRSATCVVFNENDKDMMEAKTFFVVDKIRRFAKDDETQKYHGQVIIKHKTFDVELSEWEYTELKKNNKISWFQIAPQRGRSNNSVLLLRDKVTKEQFESIIEKTRQFGEPGFVFGNNQDQLFNPCQPAWAPVLTPGGIRQLGEVKQGDIIWSQDGWTKISKKWSTGIKDVYRYRTTAGVFYGTENHKVLSGGNKIEVKHAESIDVLRGSQFHPFLSLDPKDILDGIVFGDGTVHKASNNLITLCIGENDSDYFTSEIKDLILKKRSGVCDYCWEVETSLINSELPHTYLRTIPDRFLYGSNEKVCAFLRGLFSANGSVVRDRVTLKATSIDVVEKVQIMLSSVGIKSYFTTNRGKEVEFSNGTYKCKESYDLNITTDRVLFSSLIGFIQKYKNSKLNSAIENTNTSSGKNTYDIISRDFISTEEVFDITVEGDSHTYWTGGLNVSNCFEIGFIPVTNDGVCGVQFCNLTTQNGGKITSKEKFADATKAATIIGTLQASYTHFPYLSPAARKLTEQEALLGVSITGMMENPDILLNPEIQKEMAELAKATNVEWAKKLGINPAARITCVKPEGTSSLVLGTASGIHPHHAHRYFRRIICGKIENPYKHFKKFNPHAVEESVYSVNKTDDVATFPLQVSEKAMVKADLDAIKHLEIIKSTQQNWVIPGTGATNTKPIEHNVSCTVMVKEDEWNKVIDYLYTNRALFAAVSLLPSSGDKIYKQAPMEAISTPEDEEKWANLIKNWKAVDYKLLKEDDDETQLQANLSCGGGKCEI